MGDASCVWVGAGGSRGGGPKSNQESPWHALGACLPSFDHRAPCLHPMHAGAHAHAHPLVCGSWQCAQMAYAFIARGMTLAACAGNTFNVCAVGCCCRCCQRRLLLLLLLRPLQLAVPPRPMRPRMEPSTGFAQFWPSAHRAPDPPNPPNKNLRISTPQTRTYVSQARHTCPPHPPR